MHNVDFFKWEESYSVHVKEIDDQHKHLVGLINALHETMRRGAPPAEIECLLQDLLAYTDFHFAAEERLMALANYQGLPAHRAKHSAMRQEVERLLGASKAARTASIAITLMGFLKNWLSRHIEGTDKQYVPAMKQAGVA